MMKDALLEIGSEELPASFIGIGMSQLKGIAESSLKENGLPYSAIHAYGTPRRLAVVISGLPDRSPDQERVMAGPPAAKGKDSSGLWTQAAVGFAAKKWATPGRINRQRRPAVRGPEDQRRSDAAGIGSALSELD